MSNDYQYYSNSLPALLKRWPASLFICISQLFVSTDRFVASGTTVRMMNGLGLHMCLHNLSDEPRFARLFTQFKGEKIGKLYKFLFHLAQGRNWLPSVPPFSHRF